MKNMAQNSIDERIALAQQLATKIAHIITDAISTRGSATLVVSGGGTPVPFFDALRQYDIAWSKLTVLVADERWVAVNDADSNEGLVRKHFHPDTNIFSLAPCDNSETVQSGEKRLDSALKNTITTMFDAVILGMGDDGHTASLFPHHAALPAGLDAANACIAVTDSPKPPSQRISLSAPRLMNTRALFLHITGNSKQSVLEQAKNTHDTHALPISIFLQHSPVDITIFWAP